MTGIDPKRTLALALQWQYLVIARHVDVTPDPTHIAADESGRGAKNPLIVSALGQKRSFRQRPLFAKGGHSGKVF